MELLGLVQLDWLADRYPSQLSGGQRQRIALACAAGGRTRRCCCSMNPSARSTPRCARKLRRWLRRLHDEMHISSRFSSPTTRKRPWSRRPGGGHEPRPHRTDRFPDEVYSNPASPFVHQFLGNVNVFHSRSRAASPRSSREAAKRPPPSSVPTTSISCARTAKAACRRRCSTCTPSARWCGSNCCTTAKSSRSNCPAKGRRCVAPRGRPGRLVPAAPDEGLRPEASLAPPPARQPSSSDAGRKRARGGG